MMGNQALRWLQSLLLCTIIMTSAAAIAQETSPSPAEVTDDEVNTVAARMYCPICEMEPLDTCRATTCQQWRAIIREKLAAGESSDEIVSYFVENYGDRVVGIPQDQGLRGLSLAGPILAAIVALIIGVATFMRWQRSSVNDPVMQTGIENGEAVQNGEADEYRKRIENDLV